MLLKYDWWNLHDVVVARKMDFDVWMVEVSTDKGSG